MQHLPGPGCRCRGSSRCSIAPEPRRETQPGEISIHSSSCLPGRSNSRLTQFSSEADVLVRPGRGRGRRRVPVGRPSAVGSHDDRILCRRPLSHRISKSQGLDLRACSGPHWPRDVQMNPVFQAHMLLAHQCHDTCSALSTYGVPGLLGWTAQLLLQIRDCEDPTT